MGRCDWNVPFVGTPQTSRWALGVWYGRDAGDDRIGTASYVLYTTLLRSHITALDKYLAYRSLTPESTADLSLATTDNTRLCYLITSIDWWFLHKLCIFISGGVTPRPEQRRHGSWDKTVSHDQPYLKILSGVPLAYLH